MPLGQTLGHFWFRAVRARVRPSGNPSKTRGKPSHAVPPNPPDPVWEQNVGGSNPLAPTT